MNRSSLMRLRPLLVRLEHLLQLVLTKGPRMLKRFISLPLIASMLVLLAEPKEMVVHSSIIRLPSSAQV